MSDTPLNDALKDCPFCGGDVSLEETQDEHRDPIYGYRKWWGVVCRNTTNLGGTCAIQILPSASKEAATERWNTRANTPDSAAQGAMEAPLANWGSRHTSDLSGLVNELMTLADHKGISQGWLRQAMRTIANGVHQYVAQPSDATAQPIDKNYVPGEWFDVKTIDEMSAFYMSRLPAIREAAKELGFAIGLHGSTRRDFDLMAMPWRDDAADKDTLAHAIAMAACGITRDCTYQWEQKPLGRVATSIPICWVAKEIKQISSGHIDLSIIASVPSSQHSACNYIGSCGCKTPCDAQPRVDLTDERAAFSHELWATAQLLPNEGIEDGVARIVELLANTAQGKPEQISAGLSATMGRIIDCLEILDKRPRPFCRDCADECGICPNDKLNCDMRALIKAGRDLLAAKKG